MKWCPRCETEKPPEEFGKRAASSDGLQSYCKDCQREYRRETLDDGRTREAHYSAAYYEKNQERRVEYTTDRMRKHKRILVDERGGACERCGYDRSYAALQFHHRDPEEKVFEIGTRLSMSLDSLRVEAEKCDLLCANCHAEEHDPYISEVTGEHIA